MSSIITAAAAWLVQDVVRPMIIGGALGLGLVGAFGLVDAIVWWIR